MDPLVTVILNSFNQAEFLPEAIQSVLDQTLDDFELLIVDNGSTDGSHEVIRSFDDTRIVSHLYSENRPVTVRFNAALREARGTYVSFLYSDDLYLPDKLSSQTRRFSELDHDFGVVYSPAIGWNVLTNRRWTYGSVGVSGWIFEQLLQRHFAGQIDMLSPLIRRECLLLHPFNEAIFAEGEAVFFRIALTHKFSYVTEPTVVLRDHGNNAGKAIRRNSEMTMDALSALEAHPRLSDEQRHLVLQFRARLLASYAWQGARLGEDPTWVRARLAEGARLSPTILLSPRSIASIVLCSAPRPARDMANRIGRRLRSNPGNDILVDRFGGALDDDAPAANG